MFDWTAWRTTFTTTIAGHRIEGQVRRDDSDEIESRLLVDGMVMTIDVLPDTSVSPIYLPTTTGFVLINR